MSEIKNSKPARFNVAKSKQHLKCGDCGEPYTHCTIGALRPGVHEIKS